MTRTLPWGREEKIEISLPAGWRVVVDHQGQARPTLEDLAGSAARALEHPDDGPPLLELAAGARRAVMVIDDVGRPTPAHLMAPAVMNSLLASGLREEQIGVVFAVATHRPMTAEEMLRKAGPEVFRRLRCVNHNCRDYSRLKLFDDTSLGTQVYFNEEVAAAEVRVLIGTIEPHPQAGFGGGLKNLLPGCAGSATIGLNHLLLPSPDRWNMIGTRPEENPMRQDLEDAARKLPGKNFILNTVLGPDLKPVALVSGDPILAHRRGVAVARELYGVKLPRRLDAIVSSSFPMDVDLRQGVKGVANMPGAVKKGGVIICFLKCERGLEDIRPPKWVPPLGLLRLLLKVLGAGGIYRLTKKLPDRVPVETQFIINFGLQVLKDYHVLIFSPLLCKETRGRFREFLFDDQAPMFARAEKLLRTAAPEVGLIAEGGVSFPMVSST